MRAFLEEIGTKNYSINQVQTLIKNQKENEIHRLNNMERLISEFIAFKNEVKEEKLNLLDMANYTHEYIDDANDRTDFLEIIKIVKNYLTNVQKEKNKIKLNQSLFINKKFKIDTLFKNLLDSTSQFPLEKVFNISVISKSFTKFEEDIEDKRDIVNSLISVGLQFTSNYFPIIQHKIKGKKNEEISQEMKVSLNKYFLTQSLLKVEEAIEEVCEFYYRLYNLLETWEIGENSLTFDNLHFLYNNFSEMNFKRLKKLMTHVFFMFKNNSNLKLNNFQLLQESEDDQNTSQNFEEMNKVNLIEPKFLPEDNWMEFKIVYPIDFYENQINKQLVSSKHKDWFVRPHHIETLTEHPKSIKDNWLNPKYYSKIESQENNSMSESFENWKNQNNQMTTEEKEIRSNLKNTNNIIKQIQNARDIITARMAYSGYYHVFQSKTT
jgi:hypothetical protein